MSTVSITKTGATYPQLAPYNPSHPFPELLYEPDIDSSNGVFEGVRNCFRELDYDHANFGSSNWNPLGWLIKPGDRVFLKPNMISQRHTLRHEEWDYVITHGSVIRAVVDYVAIALQGSGRIIIGDAPQTDSKIAEISAHMGLRQIQEVFRTFPDLSIDLVDLRDEYWVEKDGIFMETVRLLGDPSGSVEVDLAEHSLFAELDGQGNQYYGAFYDVEETNEHHRDGKHEYSISRTPIDSDVFISLPKLKTHKKCGLTLNLKGLVGINANKNWLPHYIIGSPDEGGDQFEKSSGKSKLENLLVLGAKNILLKDYPGFKWLARRTKSLGYFVFGGTEEVVRSGNWYKNDTVWRMSLDLNRILMYANPDGTMRARGQAKRFFSVVDGVVGMEGNGPVAGDRVETGIVLAGDNPVAVDAVCARVMGFDFRTLPLVARAFEQHAYPLCSEPCEEIVVKSDHGPWNRMLSEWDSKDVFRLRPHFGWVGKIEIDD